MNDASNLDLILLSVTGKNWTKVAMVLARAAEEAGVKFSGDDKYEVLAKRIEVLVSDGLLASQGDISKWRFSEVKRV